MEYRRLGTSGIKVSAMSLGSFVTFGNQLNQDEAVEIMSTAYGAGINFFDTAEQYGQGLAESMMGNAIEHLGWPRHSFVVATKFYWGIHGDPNGTDTLNRKYLLEAIDPSLRRLGLDHVDIVFCHRFDDATKLEEIVWAMSDLVSRGKTHYWGTSNWPATKIREAWEIADRYALHKPIVEQTEYSLLSRRTVEVDYATIVDELGIGLTCYGPLAKGLLSGKYMSGNQPQSSRMELIPKLKNTLTDPDKNRAVAELSRVAAELGCTSSQLAIAWAMANQQVSSVLTGASKTAQLVENLAAVELSTQLSGDTYRSIAGIFDGVSDT